MPTSPLIADTLSRGHAAVYVRMSTEHQNYSTEHQRAHLYAFAADRGLKIVQEYEDNGKSGLDIKRRAGLQSLIRDVQSGTPAFATVLVYDVSRWGRFQDVDESAHYEYVCRSAGITVLYCAEQFENDGSPMAALMKSIKRTMAAEYSRELSTKVFDAQCRFVAMGYKQGGSAGYALRRLVIGPDGATKHILGYGDRKGAACDRVVFVKGPDSEVTVLRDIYAMYIEERLGETEITRRLNAAEIPSEFGRPWTPWLVHSLLTNEKYIGNLVFNRGSFKLQRKAVHNPSHLWIRRDATFEPPLGADVFKLAQAERARRQLKPDKAALLRLLRDLYLTHGKLTTALLTQYVNSTMPKLLARHFGTITHAYVLAGIPTTSTYEYVATRRFVAETKHNTIEQVIRHCRNASHDVAVGITAGEVIIDQNITVNIIVLRSRNYANGLVRWKLARNHFEQNDFVIAVQLDCGNTEIAGYYLIPSANLDGLDLTIRQERLADHSKYWFSQLSEMFV